MTLLEIGQKLHMTRENVRLIEARALKKLRRIFNILLTQGGGADAVIEQAVRDARTLEKKARATRAAGLVQKAKKAARALAREGAS